MQGEQLARQLLANPRAAVHLAGETGVYVGTIVGETPTHWIQRISPNMAVLHEKTRTPALGIGQAGALRYSAGRAEVTPERLPSQDRSLGR